MFQHYEIHFTASNRTEVQILPVMVVEGETTKMDFEKMAACRIFGDPKRANEITLLATTIV